MKNKQTKKQTKNKQKKYQESICKYKVAFYAVNSPHWPVM